MPLRTCNTARLTKRELLESILRDGGWHSTRELARRVGHTFGMAVFNLRRDNQHVERRRHPSAAFQHQYRLTRYEHA